MMGPEELIGVAPATLQSWLADAQQALQDIAVGGKVRTLAIGGGGTQRTVTYNQTNLGALRVWIAELQQALGLRRHQRRAMGVTFR